MKTLSALTVLLASAMTLTACGGGSSDSSGGTTTTTTTTTPSTATNTGANGLTSCPVTGSTVYATTSGCTYSSPAINSGASITYTCVGGRVNSSIGMSAKNINLNGITITCKP